jgi:hypothetical protein
VPRGNWAGLLRWREALQLRGHSATGLDGLADAVNMTTDWSATGSPDGKRRLLTSARWAKMRPKRADLYEKLRQLSAFSERERRR